MKREEAIISLEELLSHIRELYGLETGELKPFDFHEGGRNLVLFTDTQPRRIIRISYLDDRALQDYRAETEYMRYLRTGGAHVAGVLESRRGNLVEEVRAGSSTCYVSMFEYARGDLLVDHHYQYREGAPLEEYFYNCGKTLGKMHELSKKYRPRTARYDFFDRYCPELIDRLVPHSLPELKARLNRLLADLNGLERTPECYGMVHFDYSDGNYHIDYDTGDITVFDFDNCCTCWYMYDLANLWTHGVVWVMFEPDAKRRKAFMDSYFAAVVDGYRSETELSDAMLEKLPVFVQAVLMENILDEFETQQFEGTYPEIDGEMKWRMWCMLEDIPFLGFFHERYDTNSPMEAETPD